MYHILRFITYIYYLLIVIGALVNKYQVYDIVKIKFFKN